MPLVRPSPPSRPPSHSSSLNEPLLARASLVENDGRSTIEGGISKSIKEDQTSTETLSFSRKYFGTDTQRGCFLLFITAVICDIHSLRRLVMVILHYHHQDHSTGMVLLLVDVIMYLIALTLLSLGAWKGYTASAPHRILYTAFYHNHHHHHNDDDEEEEEEEAVVYPSSEASFWSIHLGTGLLVSSQTLLLGSVVYLLSTIFDIIITLSFSYNNQSSTTTTIGMGICSMVGGILLVTACYYNNIATYPENMLRPFDPQIVQWLERNNKQWLIRHIGTDMQMSAWTWALLSIFWFITSAIAFDCHHLAVTSSYSYIYLLNVLCSLLLGIGSYYMLRQSYNEGTKFDTLLVNAFNNNNNTTVRHMKDVMSLDNDEGQDKKNKNGAHDDDDIENGGHGSSSTSVVPGPLSSSYRVGGGGGKDRYKHPLHDVVDRQLIGLVNMDHVVNKSLDFLQNKDNWYNSSDDDSRDELEDKALHTNKDNDDTPSSGPTTPSPSPNHHPTSTSSSMIWKYRYGPALKCSDVLSNIDPLLLGAVLQSKSFKLSLMDQAGVGKVVLVDEVDLNTLVYYERHPPYPPMPLSEFTYCSHIHTLPCSSNHDDTNDEDRLLLVEWGVTPSAQAQVDPKAARLDPYRVYCLQSLPTARTKITTATFLSSTTTTTNTTSSSSSRVLLPSFLLDEELKKVPEIFPDLEAFLSNKDAMAEVAEKLEFRIWQEVHTHITPLLTGVLVRASPAYRSMIANFPGLRARVPSLSTTTITNTTTTHPLSSMPTTLSQAITTDGILEAFTTALVFINNNFDDNWTLASTTTRSSSSTTSFIHNPFGHHHNNTSSSSDGGMFKLTTWRRKIEGEVIDPYRITCKAQGIDPLTLATIWQDIPHFRTAHHIGIDSAEDITTDAITKASHHHHDCMDSIKVYIVHMKGYGTMRKREAVIISIMKEISASKVAVLEYSIPPITGNDDDVLSNYTPDKSSVHITTTFNVALFENDAGANTKVTIAGLVPVGGKTEKLKLSIMAEREVKAQQKLMTLMYNYFTDTSEGRSLVINTRTTILGKVWKPLLSDSSIALSKLQLQFLKANSDTFNMLCNEEDHINTNSSDK